MTDDMYSEEMEQHLARVERWDSELATKLREMRERLATPEHLEAVAHYEAGEAARQRFDREQRLIEWGVPARVIKLLTGRAYRETDVSRRLELSLVRGARMLILGGPPGTGKTAAACRALWTNKAGRYIKSVRYASLQPNERGDVLRRLYGETCFLVLDDLGMDPDHLIWRVNELLAERYDERERAYTIITTNLSREDLERRYSKPIIQRIVELGGYLRADEVLRKSFREAQQTLPTGGGE